MVRFDYIEPCSLKEATTLVSAQDTKGKIIAGGTDLLVQIKERKLDVDRLISLSKIPGLRFIHDDGRWINIGTMTTIRDLEQSSVVQKSLPVLFDAVEGFGSVQIRNVATLGGNICNGAPSADTLPPLLALRAQVTYQNSRGMKRQGLNEFFVGPGKTVLCREDILMEIHFEKPHTRSGGAYLKFSRRKGMDIPLLGIAVQLQTDESFSFFEEVTIALGVAAPTPIRAKQAEEVLKGEKVTEKILAYAAALASQGAKPRDSFRCSAEYRRAMIKNLLPKVIKSALSRIEKRLEKEI